MASGLQFQMSAFRGVCCGGTWVVATGTRGGPFGGGENGHQGPKRSLVEGCRTSNTQHAIVFNSVRMCACTVVTDIASANLERGTQC